MKRYFLLLVAVIFLSQGAQAQLVQKAVVTKALFPYNVGDTIPVYGMKLTNGGKVQYYIEGSEGDRYAQEDRLQLLPNSFDYWDNVWFEHRAADIKKEGWEEDKRQMLQEDALEYYQNAKNNNMIYEDELLTDYLYQLVFRIYPKELIKERVSNFSIVVIKSLAAESFAFDNGMIVFTTAQIAKTKSETDLVKLLTNRVANIVLEHNLLNLRQQIRAERRAAMWGNLVTLASSAAMIHSNYKYGTRFEYFDALDLGISAHFISAAVLENIGAKYSREQNLEAFSVASRYLADQNLNLGTEEEYLANISGAISYNAWQEYHMKNYEFALSLVDRLYQTRLATEEDYLLLSKIFRKTSNTEESNRKALTFIRDANEVAITNLVDLNKEAGLIYLRLKDLENAKTSFTNYREGLLEMQKAGENVAKELNEVNQIMFKYKLQG
jgi:hypothetical protein